MPVIIGIDTSCYTTSVAVIDEHGKQLADNRRLLAVEEGGRGIAQSAALFQHIREGSDVLAQTLAAVDKNQVAAVAVSTAPRTLINSYMPVFLAGVNAAKILAAAYAVPLYGFSHQEGHIMAAAVTSKMPEKQEFLAIHLSGGTSELLQVKTTPIGFDIKILGAGSDLHAGQFVDRVGVALGIPFPAGAGLDALACSCKSRCNAIKAAVQGMDFSFSGPESAAQRMVAKGENAEQIACAVLECIAQTLLKSLQNALNTTKLTDILFSGGVAGSTYLKQRLQEGLANRAELYFAPPAYARDNALGIAYLGKKAYYESTHINLGGLM